MDDSNTNEQYVKRIGRPPSIDWTHLKEDAERVGSLAGIAELYDCAPDTVRRKLKAEGIDLPTASRERIDYTNVVADYNKLKSLRKVAKLYQCTKKSVADALRRRGVILQDPGGVSWLDDARILEDFERLESVRLVAAEHDCSQGAINAVLKRQGITRAEWFCLLVCQSCGDAFLSRSSRRKVCYKEGCQPHCLVRWCDRKVHCKQLCARHGAQARHYGLSPLELADMVEDGCLICGETDGLCIDHDHSCCEVTPTCGKCTRGALCHRHNQACGYLRDSPDEAGAIAAYLLKWQESHN